MAIGIKITVPPTISSSISTSQNITSTSGEIPVGRKGDKGDKGDTGSAGINGTNGIDGVDGDSAHQIAVNNGFVGTESQWLLSIKGDKGDKGEAGERGIQGLTGEKGDTGNNGLDGYTPIKNIDYFDGAKGDKGDIGEQGLKGDKGDTGLQGIQGNAGYTPIKGIDYFDGLQGEQGTQGLKGDMGDTGTNGADGVDGKSAYEIAVDNGFVGTESQWILSIKGEQGDSGIQGIQGLQGIQGIQGAQGTQGEKGSDAVIFSTTVEIDFGNRSSYEKKIVTGLSWVASTTKIIPVLYGEDVGNRSAEDGVIEGIVLSISNIIAGVGFTLHAYAPQTTNGIYKVMCIGG